MEGQNQNNLNTTTNLNETNNLNQNNLNTLNNANTANTVNQSSLNAMNNAETTNTVNPSSLNAMNNVETTNTVNPGDLNTMDNVETTNTINPSNLNSTDGFTPSNGEEPKKKNNLTKVIIAVVALAVIGVGAFFVYDKFIADDKEPNNDVNENKDQNSDEDIKDLIDQIQGGNTNVNVPDCQDEDGCTLEYNGFKFEIGRDSTYSKQTLKINGKSVLEDIELFKYDMSVNEDIKFIEDVAIVRIYSGMQVFVFAFDKEGNQLLSTITIDKQFGSNMVLAGFDEGADRMTIEGNKIKLKATRFKDGPGIRGEQGLINNNTSCDIIVEGTYEIEYLGNGKFSEIKNTSYSTLRDVYKDYQYDEYVNCN